MTARLKGLSRTPLFIQVLALMSISFAVAQVITAIILLSLPTPSPITYSFGEITRAYEGQPIVGDKALRIIDKAKAPDKSFDNSDNVQGRQINNMFRRRLGELLIPQVSPEKVAIRQSFARWRDYLGPRPRNADPIDFFVVAPFQVRVQQDDGHWKEIRSPVTLRLDPASRSILIALLTSFIGVVAAAWMSARVLAGPIVKFASAAKRLGRDPNSPPLSLRGSSEIITAASAFNEMQQRLRRYVDDRTAMIGAIAHDLRTPLTRLRFRIEGTPEDLRAKLAADLDQMEEMISATLGFVRDATHASARTPLELSSLLQSLADDMTDTGANVIMERADKIVLEGDSLGLKRLFANLLENAVKYGKTARVRVIAEPNAAVVEIDDDGPGVPENELDRVFEPFYRREPSRNRDTGGIGLGLAVVRTISRAHGGDTELLNRKGGLTARVRLPI